MRIRIKSPDCRLFLPIPDALAGLVLRLLPESAFTDMQKSFPEAFRPLVNRENACALWRECREILRAHKGLEVVRVEGKEDVFVSIKL